MNTFPWYNYRLPSRYDIPTNETLTNQRATDRFPLRQFRPATRGNPSKLSPSIQQMVVEIRGKFDEDQMFLLQGMSAQAAAKAIGNINTGRSYI
jgi:hypothetical protein